MKQIKQSQVPNKIYPFDHITLTHWHERKVRENRFPFGRGIFLFFLNQNIKLFMLFRALSLWPNKPVLHCLTWIAFTFAVSRAVTHFCLSTSLDARKWKVCVPPPLLTTKLKEAGFSVWMRAPCRLMVPLQVWAISAWFLRRGKLVVTRWISGKCYVIKKGSIALN